MAGSVLDLANSSLITVRATADRLADGSLEPQLAAASVTDALDVVSASMAQMTVSEAYLTRLRITETQDHVWGLFHDSPRDPLKAWARHQVSRMAAIARSGL